MKTKKLIERLERIWQDLPMEAMRQSSELEALIEELKDDVKKFRLFKLENGITLYWGSQGWWTAHKEWAAKYGKKTAVKMQKRFECLKEEVE